MGVVVNEFNEWWLNHLAQETEKAKKRADRLYPTRVLSNKLKREIFMDCFHWAMLEQRLTMEQLYDKK